MKKIQKSNNTQFKRISERESIFQQFVKAQDNVIHDQDLFKQTK